MTSPIRVTRFTLGPFEQNCYLLIGPSARRAALVDPGLQSEVVLQALHEQDLELEWIINTHGHVDHVAGNHFFKQHTGARLIIHPADAEMAARARSQFEQLQRLGFGLDLRVPDSPPPDAFFEEGRPFIFDGARFEVIHTPGHSPGGVCLAWDGNAIVGDTLFRGSIGRTDLPHGSHTELLTSIRDKLFRLPDHTVCHPGHGPETTLGEERRSNPFVSDGAVGMLP